jgi:hypothetical protein
MLLHDRLISHEELVTIIDCMLLVYRFVRAP